MYSVPDEEMPAITETAKLLDVIRGDDVERMDMLVSCAIRKDNDSWF